MIRSVIVEDDPYFIEELRTLLAEVDDGIVIVGIAKNIHEAFDEIAAKNPELVFLDIELGNNKKAGFDLLKRIRKATFAVIFTTAHADNNVENIRMYGLDHIMKPYRSEDLNDALNKFYEKRTEEIGTEQVDSLIKNISSDNLEEQDAWIRDGKKLIRVQFKNITYIESCGEHTKIFYLDFFDNLPVSVESPHRIGEWEHFLQKGKFYRIHLNCLVNSAHIQTFDQETRQLMLSDKTPLQVAKRRVHGLIDLLPQL